MCGWDKRRYIGKKTGVWSRWNISHRWQLSPTRKAICRQKIVKQCLDFLKLIRTRLRGVASGNYNTGGKCTLRIGNYVRRYAKKHRQHAITVQRAHDCMFTEFSAERNLFLYKRIESQYKRGPLPRELYLKGSRRAFYSSGFCSETIKLMKIVFDLHRRTVQL